HRGSDRPRRGRRRRWGGRDAGRRCFRAWQPSWNAWARRPLPKRQACARPIAGGGMPRGALVGRHADAALPAPCVVPMRVQYHRTLLADRVRNGAFHAALARRIVPGKTTVADIGAGSGFLGFLAAKLGAKRVDLYEAAEVVGLARKLLRRNRLPNCRIAGVHSTEVLEPDRVDLVVCETLGNYPFEANIITTLNDARARY